MNKVCQQTNKSADTRRQVSPLTLVVAGAAAGCGSGPVVGCVVFVHTGAAHSTGALVLLCMGRGPAAELGEVREARRTIIVGVPLKKENETCQSILVLVGPATYTLGANRYTR